MRNGKEQLMFVLHVLFLLHVVVTASRQSQSLVPNVWGLTTLKQKEQQKEQWWSFRGGDSSLPSATETTNDKGTKVLQQEEEQETTNTEDEEDEPSLEERVQNAMKKLGIQSNLSEQEEEQETTTENECKDGVCPMPSESETIVKEEEERVVVDPHELAESIAKEMNVDKDLAMAALGATSQMNPTNGKIISFNQEAAKSLIQTELDMIATISPESSEVKDLVQEGFDEFLVRRALAFAERNVENARAILIADQQDAEYEYQQQQQREEEPEEEDLTAEITAQLRKEAEEFDDTTTTSSPPPPMKTINVDPNFDPTSSFSSSPPPPQQQQAPSPSSGMQPPPPANKEDVIFDATTADIQRLVLESPVPVLLDVYADWCGPCKTLTPILEEIVIKAGGHLRLVKVNSDNERALTSTALGVTALPTVFGIRNGQILHSFRGMPRSQEMMQNFLMGLLMPGEEPNFDPPLSEQEKKHNFELTLAMIKVASASGFSFAQREGLQNFMNIKLDELVTARNDDMADAESSASTLRSLLSNMIRNPFETKFQRINLQNKVIASKITPFPPCLQILKRLGFIMTENNNKSMVLKGIGTKVVHVAPMTVARDSIDKWIDTNRHRVAVDARRKQDERDRERLAKEAAERGDNDDDEEEEEEEEVDPNLVSLSVRVEGKKKVHKLNHLNADDATLQHVLDALPVELDQDNVQIICAAKRLVVKTFNQDDQEKMKQSLRELNLFPVASLIIKEGTTTNNTTSGSSLKERAAAQKNRKKGSHTMQSTGIYAKDDHLKGELIDGGGGTLFEHDVSDDEDDEEEEEKEEDKEETDKDDENDKDDDDEKEEEGDEDEEEDEVEDN